MNYFNATKTLKAIRKNKKISRRKAYRRSKLENFRTELVRMSNDDGSLGDLQVWLRSVKKVNASRSTIYRYLYSLPEARKYGDYNND